MSTAFKPADILLPDNTDMNKWAVIACDQYTSEPQYWENLNSYVNGEKSTLNLILPEVYLENPDVSERIENIHRTMNQYLESGTFKEYKNSMIYLERVQNNGILRCGVIGMIDLEEYDFSKGSTSQVRATEATVIERIPPRIKVREGAPLELPHIMILIDDENKSAIEPISGKKSEMEELYNFDLNCNGGHVSGWLMNENMITDFQSSLDKLGDTDTFKAKYGCDDVLLYAMGDGNHSLATAKTYYENLKKAEPDKDFSNHPARYALVEIVNLHSPALDFEAIHRIVSDTDTKKLIDAMTETLGLSDEKSEQSFTYVTGNTEHTFYIHNKTSNLTVGSLQNFLDAYLKENGGKIDYIHGTDTLKKLVADTDGSVGFILPDMDKSELFPTVIKDGALPRKTFSMGHAEDKRFYIECRKIS
ncbi:MAG: DUF1015 domain-containing protein [Oscillospiraceae bacterium]|nr:DUF1015 domain-containing protein [Oscillospiraceae bacterium]